MNENDTNEQSDKAPSGRTRLWAFVGGRGGAGAKLLALTCATGGSRGDVWRELRRTLPLISGVAPVPEV